MLLETQSRTRRVRSHRFTRLATVSKLPLGRKYHRRRTVAIVLFLFFYLNPFTCLTLVPFLTLEKQKRGVPNSSNWLLFNSKSFSITTNFIRPFFVSFLPSDHYRRNFALPAIKFVVFFGRTLALHPFTLLSLTVDINGRKEGTFVRYHPALWLLNLNVRTVNQGLPLLFTAKHGKSKYLFHPHLRARKPPREL